ncbi:hypothetical protein [Caballeronia sp.]|jgi:NAD(P)-dependent dehydrogenase (short-subunit alcohol dehydrogenase family)|uniref:hypothetical protein n=1 Tax=Caballeronia sp. TaxID=1931223 RepID=UPI003C635C54
MLTVQLAAELKDAGIKVNAVDPGLYGNRSERAPRLPVGTAGSRCRDPLGVAPR